MVAPSGFPATPYVPLAPARESRYASDGLDGNAEPSRAAVAVGSPGFACGATTRNAGAAFSQQYPVDVGSRGWAVGMNTGWLDWPSP